MFNLRIILIRAAVFSAIFLIAAWLMERGNLPRILLLTLAATAIYILCAAVAARLAGRK